MAKAIRSYPYDSQTHHVSADPFDPDQQIGFKHFQQLRILFHLNFSPQLTRAAPWQPPSSPQLWRGP